MIIKHFCNSTFQGSYHYETIFKEKSVISNGSLFFIDGIEYRVTNISIRKESEIVVESIKIEQLTPR